MQRLLHTHQDFGYYVADEFASHMLVPLIRNLQDKAEHEWDDYNEAYHGCRLIETVRKHPGMTMDFHYQQKDGKTSGIGIVTRGTLDPSVFFPETFRWPEPDGSAVVFNYFHIAPESRGTGKYWLKNIILPYYAAQGFASLYVKSSHPKAFSLYGRLGSEVGEYRTPSDNGLYLRDGKIFRIALTRETHTDY